MQKVLIVSSIQIINRLDKRIAIIYYTIPLNFIINSLNNTVHQFFKDIADEDDLVCHFFMYLSQHFQPNCVCNKK